MTGFCLPRILPAVLLTLAGWLAASGVVSAAPPETLHFKIDETFLDDPMTTDDDLCGIPVTTRVVGISNLHISVTEAGFVDFKGNDNVTVTWTSNLTGKSISNRVTQAFRDTIKDNGDGTITITTAVTGIPERLITANGRTLIKDRGRIVFVNIVDYNGTPEDPSDDTFIDGYIASVSGPHPEADSDFALFCQIVTAELT